jgi:hypothetical protein
MGSIPNEFIGFFNWPNPSSRTMAPGSTQPLTEMSIRNLLGVNVRPACKADNLNAICEPIVWKMWESPRLTILWASMACYRITLTFLRLQACNPSYRLWCFQPLPAVWMGRFISRESTVCVCVCVCVCVWEREREREREAVPTCHNLSPNILCLILCLPQMGLVNLPFSRNLTLTMHECLLYIFSSHFPVNKQLLCTKAFTKY